MEEVKIGQVIKVGVNYGIVMPFVDNSELYKLYNTREYDNKTDLIVSYFTYYNSKQYIKYNGWDRISVIKQKITKVFDVHQTYIAGLSYEDGNTLDEMIEGEIDVGGTMQCIFSKLSTKNVNFNDVTYALNFRDIRTIEELICNKAI